MIKKLTNSLLSFGIIQSIILQNQKFVQSYFSIRQKLFFFALEIQKLIKAYYSNKQ